MEDKLAKDQGLTESFHLGSIFLASSHNPTPGPALVPILVLALVPLQLLLINYLNNL